MRGFVSRPQVQKNNRNSVFLFVNGRLIRDRLLLHALSSAYHNLMPPACYPFALLFLECEPHEVDVNVHPSKTEVRFRHSNFVHDFVRDALRAALIEGRPVASAPLPTSSLSPGFAPAMPWACLPVRWVASPVARWVGRLRPYRRPSSRIRSPARRWLTPSSPSRSKTCATTKPATCSPARPVSP